MNDGQRRLTVKQIEKYNQEAEKFDSKALTNVAFMIGGCALSVFCFQNVATMPMGIENVVLAGLGGMGSYTTIESLRRMVGNMAKKSGLENMATNLQFQLDRDKLGNDESSKGRSL